MTEEGGAGVRLLRAQGVSVSYGDVHVLTDLDLTVEAGECLAVLGENGAGKTTLLRVLVGQLRPKSGEVTCLGHVVDERNQQVRQAIAALVGVPAFYPDLTVEEQLRLVCATWGMADDEAWTRVDEFLDATALSGLGTRFPNELSSGQTQLFHLAMTFIRPAEVFVLDEPEQRLDPSRKQRLINLIRQALDAGAGVVMTSHDPAVVDAVASQRISLDAP